MPSSKSSTTPTPTFLPDQLLKIAEETGHTLIDLENIGQQCFKPYVEAIESGTHKKDYVKNLPGTQGYTDVFASLNANGLTEGVNSLDGKHHIFQHCHYVACYQTERIEMPQEKSVDTSREVRELFAPAMESGEKLKIRAGSAGTVFYNDSDVGKQQDRLTPETYRQIESALLNDTGTRVEVPLNESGKPKRPEVEVVAVSKEGEERTLFRQEKGMGLSTNTVVNLTKQLGMEPETQPASVDPMPEPIPSDEQPVSAETQPVDAQPATVEPAPNAVETFKSSVEKLPPSKTKALWRKISADVSALNAQLKAVSQTGRGLTSAVTEVPKAIQNDTQALIQQGRQKLESIRAKVETKVKQTSIDDIASIAIMGAGKAVEAGSKGLGIASRYLSDRADRVKSYGMAKAALAVYNKGNSRTGESIFKANGYTVEAVTEGYTVKDSKDRLIMSFATDSKGKPISVTKGSTIQPADYRAINKAAKSPVIQGSIAGEAAYKQRLETIVKGMKEVIPEGTKVPGNNHFHVSRPSSQELTVSTHGFPQRQLQVDAGGEISTSNLTIQDMDRLDRGIEQTPKQAIKEPEKAKVGIEMG